MNLLCDKTRPPVILSYGRSGSTILCHDIGQANSCSPLTVEATSADFLTSAPSTAAIHSHQLHPARDLAGFTCFFNLRKNPVETILSLVLAQHYDLFHVWSSQSAVELEPSEFTDFESIGHKCLGYCRWHNYYSELLQPDHRIVFYEDYVQQLDSNAVYRRTFPDKRYLIANYRQVLEYILEFEESMLASQVRFGQ